MFAQVAGEKLADIGIFDRGQGSNLDIDLETSFQSAGPQSTFSVPRRLIRTPHQNLLSRDACYRSSCEVNQAPKCMD